MISYLEGEILNKGKNYIIIKVGGVGYKVLVGASLLAEFNIGQNREIYIFQQVSDQGTALYGMKNIEQLNFFELLLSVSGVGPKTAMTIISSASLDDLQQSIVNNDSAMFSKLAGVSKKSAERIILEISSKLPALSVGTDNDKNIKSSDELEALLSLGYNMNEAREALKAVGNDNIDSGKKIKEALKILNKYK